jgi:hypothetical protein
VRNYQGVFSGFKVPDVQDLHIRFGWYEINGREGDVIYLSISKE